jgi:hypothetical protein
MTAFSRLSRFGMTFAPLTDDRGAELLTWYLADSRARIFSVLEKEKESPANAPACGAKWRASFARYDHNSHSLKTHQCSLFEDLKPSSVTLPRWGTMRNGELYRQPTPERLICERGSGYMPTLTASDAEAAAVIGKDDTFRKTKNGTLRKVNRNGKDGSLSLGRMVKMVPTLCAQDAKNSTLPPSQANRDSTVGWIMGTLTKSHSVRSEKFRSVAKNPYEMAAETGGELNPTWAEWFMGWPLGWTELQPLAMGKFRQWLRSHGKL